jgi:hypothetical protein
VRENLVEMEYEKLPHEGAEKIMHKTGTLKEGVRDAFGVNGTLPTPIYCGTKATPLHPYKQAQKMETKSKPIVANPKAKK